MTLYIWDFGGGNYAAGHRRWILYPPLVAVGRGDTDTSNDLYVLSTAQHPLWGTRPSSPEWVRWPPAGYVPYQVAYPRWSLSHNPNADFGGASVSLSMGGNPVPVTILQYVTGYGDVTRRAAGQEDEGGRALDAEVLEGLGVDLPCNLALADQSLHRRERRAHRMVLQPA